MKNGVHFLSFGSLAGCWSDFYVFIRLSTESVIPERESAIYEFSLIFTVFIAFRKKLFVRYDVFFTIFKNYFVFKFSLLSRKGHMFFEKAMVSVILLKYNVSKYIMMMMPSEW